MNRRRFLLGSSALVGAAAVAKALPARAIEFPPAPTSWGEVTGAAIDLGGEPAVTAITAWVDHGGMFEVGDMLVYSCGGTVADQVVRVTGIDDGLAGWITFKPDPALAPPARLR